MGLAGERDLASRPSSERSPPGLMLRDEQFDSDSRSEASLHEVLAPLESIFAAISSC